MLKVFFKTAIRGCLIAMILSGTGCMEEKTSIKPNTVFLEFEGKWKTLNTPAEKQQAVDELLATIKNSTYPIFEDDSTVVLIYSGEQDSVKVLGDMGNWFEPIPMQRLEGTSLFFLRAQYPPHARMEYLFTFGGDQWPAQDALNPHVLLNGFGPNSELAMPRYRHHSFFNEYLTGKKGQYKNIETHRLPPGILPYERIIHVYVPMGYQSTTEHYPTVYFQDGEDYIEFAQAAEVIDHLITSQQIEPLIAVFIAPPNRHKPDMPNRMTEYGLNDDYIRFMADELVPFIDSTYRTQKDPSARMVLGDSFGGLISAYAPFLRPEVFGIGYSQSGYVSFRNDQLIELFRQAEVKPILLYVDVGWYERKVGANFLPEAEMDFLTANRRFRDVLEQKGYSFIYREYPEGHTWGNWRRHLIDALNHYFGV